MTSVMEWLSFNRSVYFGNATTMRDFRVQLRGNRSALFFGAYLVVLIGVAMLVYSQATLDRSFSIVQAQLVLQNFYMTVVELLAGTICLVAPALAATTVVMERQRRSIDLVMSAPVTPKYYLVGKMLSSYRYIWMILVLSLPVTAACVVLGGASWSDVLGAYLLLSLQALVLTSVSLLMSTLAAKPVSAVLYSYAACIPYLFATTAASAYFNPSYLPYSNGENVPFFVALCPFTVKEAVGTFMTIGNYQVPNWLLAGGFSLMIAKITLLCAGSLLNPSGSEAKSLRIHGLVYMTLAFGLVGWFAHLSGIYDFTMSGGLGRIFTWMFMPMVVIMPFMACYGFDGENRFRPNGTFKVRNLFQPTPASALPYLLTLVGTSALGMVAGFALSGWQVGNTGPNWAYVSHYPSNPSPSSLGVFGVLWFLRTLGAYVAFTAGLWTFFWAVARMASSMSIGIKAARGITFAAFVLVCVTPVPLLATVDQAGAFDSGSSLWSLWVLRSTVSSFGAASSEATTYSIILVLLAIPITIYAEGRLKELKAKRSQVTVQ